MQNVQKKPDGSEPQRSTGGPPARKFNPAPRPCPSPPEHLDGAMTKQSRLVSCNTPTGKAKSGGAPSAPRSGSATESRPTPGDMAAPLAQKTADQGESSSRRVGAPDAFGHLSHSTPKEVATPQQVTGKARVGTLMKDMQTAQHQGPVSIDNVITHRSHLPEPNRTAHTKERTNQTPTKGYTRGKKASPALPRTTIQQMMTQTRRPNGNARWVANHGQTVLCPAYSEKSAIPIQQLAGAHADQSAEGRCE